MYCYYCRFFSDDARKIPVAPDSAWVWRWAGWRGTELPNPFRDTKLLGANADKEIFIFPVQLTTSRIGNLTRLIHALNIYDDYTYIHSVWSTVFIWIWVFFLPQYHSGFIREQIYIRFSFSLENERGDAGQDGRTCLARYRDLIIFSGANGVMG